MRELFKKIYKILPLSARVFLLKSTELYFKLKMILFENNSITRNGSKLNTLPKKTKKRILLYHITALYYAGTEKSLQIMAEALSKKYEVYILHSSDMLKPNRKEEVGKYATLICFDYTSIDKNYPHYINGMNPHIKTIIKKYEIDLLITAGAGKAEYPFITITNIPIILINIFGAPCLQKNIKKTIFISNAVLNHSENYTGKRIDNCVMYIPANTKIKKDDVNSLHQKLSIPDDAFIFGRIGRSSDDIFDPIGIRAFQKIVKENENVHYVIISPPPILEKIVSSENIPNVHFLPATAKEEEIWSFYYGIDALAHFRMDGETQGLNISEAMYAGKPIITHTSHIWNAHLEYLDKSFSRIAKQNDIDSYFTHMKEFVTLYSEDRTKWVSMGELAKVQAGLFFSKNTYQEKITNIVHDVIS